MLCKAKITLKKHEKLIYTVLDQGVYSGSNFVVVILLANMLSPKDFGLYSLLFASIMVLNCFQNAFITGPFKVLSISKKGNVNQNYLYFNIIAQFIISFFLGVLFFCIIYLGFDFKLKVSFVIALCLFFQQLYEFIRVYYLTKLNIKRLLIIDLLVVSMRIILLLIYLNSKVGLYECFVILSIPYCISYIFFPIKIKGKMSKNNFNDILKKNYQYGKWLFYESIAYIFSTRIYIYFVGIVINVEAVGVLNATQKILDTINVFAMGIVSYLIPKSRKQLLENGYFLWKETFINIGIFMNIIIFILLIILSMFSDYLLTLLYSSYYAQYSYLIPILAVGYMFMSINSILSAAFKTTEQPKYGVYAKLLSAIISLLYVYPALTFLDVKGAALGLVLTQFLWLCVYVYNVYIGNLSKKSVMKKISTYN